MNVAAPLAALVKARARHRCEYCGMSQSLQVATFHIEHVRPRSCSGETTAENLAFACPSCNLHKADRSHVTDPDNGDDDLFFHPRVHRWDEHFPWHGTAILGLTAIGRAAVQALDLNHPRRLRVREVEAEFDLFPPSMQA